MIELKAGFGEFVYSEGDVKEWRDLRIIALHSSILQTMGFCEDIEGSRCP
jgi:hypothetical protein